MLSLSVGWEGAMAGGAAAQRGDAASKSASKVGREPLNTEQVLRAEAEAIHGKKLDATTTGEALYRELHGLNSTALCLSGGGIRSASFALGVVEALASYPRRETLPQTAAEQAEAAKESLLAQFHYLSTVSGGGYIGSCLSAWIARCGYADVWPKLVGRREHPDKEASEIAWLRAYSNYLTPRIGLFSADTWTAVALYVRNLILNWLVILPALCLFLLAVKAFAVGTFSLLGASRPLIVLLALIGGALMIWSLAFALLNRPSRDPCGTVGLVDASEPSTPLSPDTERSPRAEAGQPKYVTDPHRNEGALTRTGANQRKFVVSCLLPAVATALLLSLYLVVRGRTIVEWNWPISRTVGVALGVGMAIYAASWIVAFPPKTWRPCRDQKDERSRTYWLRDFGSWAIAGGVYGAIIGLGVHLVANFNLWPLIGNVDVSNPTSYFLIALIYGVPWIITGQLTAEMIFVGLTNWQNFSDADREWFGRSTGWFAVVAIMWFAVMFLVLIAGPVAWELAATYDSAKYGSTLLAIASALFGTLGGTSSKSAATEQASKKAGLMARFALPLAAVTFLLLLVLGISALLDYLLFGKSLLDSTLLQPPPASRSQDVIWLIIGFCLVGFVAFIAWTRVNINRFSIHALYRNRLIRAYLGASNPRRAPNPFTGFDDADNSLMTSLWTPAKGSWQPFHVVNIALNVVNSKRLAWQERKAVPFTASPLHAGSAADNLGFRPSKEYAGGLTLGTALAISGAAASPNMGYHSSPLVTLLLALFNVRLGWWLGNPGRPGNTSYDRDGPRVAIRPFVAEMFGQTTDDRRYVYLSDGGHFENLGLYEMVRRRCRCIVVSDAGCDPNYGFEDLGNAVRKIAIDLGIYIGFGTLHELKKRSKDNGVITGAYYSIGVIDYKSAPEGTPGTENGYILYIKPGYHGTESADIVAYATANAAFPHETTADQFFSESQFESYRMLGFEIMDSVLEDAIENVGLRLQVRKYSPSMDRLADLVRALDPKVIKETRDLYQQQEKSAAANA
jgi:Patatin-like phospholipase